MTTGAGTISLSTTKDRFYTTPACTIDFGLGRLESDTCRGRSSVLQGAEPKLLVTIRYT